MKRNKFKIVTPSYNNSPWLEYNLASVLNQTYDNWEVIYINDASSDDTLQKLTRMVGNNPKYKIVNNHTNMGGTYNSITSWMSLDDDDIYVHLDGDDWLIDETVLEKLNEVYNNTDCWMTYGGFVVWNGTEYTTPFPQNTPYDDFVHKHKYYRRDTWRASHLRTYRAFLLKSLSDDAMKTLNSDEYYWHAGDLACQFPCLEICGRDKIHVVDFYTYVYNQHPSIINRTLQRESAVNHSSEHEIRNRKTYQTGLPAKKLPLVNVIGDYRERNSIPTKFSYVYNQIEGEFDITLIQDADCIKYINGQYGKLSGIVIADIHEPPYLFNQIETYTSVKNNYDKFDYIFTYVDDLLTLPNAIFRNGGHECVLNKNVHKQQYPLLADETLFSMYQKDKGISIITSNKTFTPWHVFRTECVSFIKNSNLEVDIYGVGYNEISKKLDGLKPYKYSIAIENGSFPNYFTEKILDCFLTGTIPIYKGCPNIDKYFNIDGIITFNTMDELEDIIKNIQSYHIDQSIIEQNYNTALTFCYNNDRFFERFLLPILQ